MTLPASAGRLARCPGCGVKQQVPWLPSPGAPPERADTQSPLPKQPSAPPAREDDHAPERPRYAAFISYRHVEPDRRWAKWLHTALETYRVPKQFVRQQGLPLRAGRCFRDEEELPASSSLSREIEEALQQSRFLIVVCSPRTPASEWVNKEVVRFREMGRHDHILALLIEGEPSEAFPRSLREIRRTFTDEQGREHVVSGETEPLAADVRPDPDESRRYLKRMAKLRILACVLGCMFDDLRQRDHERRTRRLLYLGSALAALLLLMAGLTGVAVKQWREAVKQGNRAGRLLSSAVAAKKSADAATARERSANEQAQKDRKQALEDRRLALEQEARAKAALADSAANEAEGLALAGEFGAAVAACLKGRAVRDNERLKMIQWNAERGRGHPWRKFDHGDRARAVAFSPDCRLLATGGEGQCVLLWDLATGAKHMRLPGPTWYRSSLTFSPDGSLLASGMADKTVWVWHVPTGKRQQILPGHTRGVLNVAFSPDGRLLASGSMDRTVRVWDTRTWQEARKLDVPSSGSRPGSETDREARCVTFSPDSQLLACGARGGMITVWNVATGEEALSARGQCTEGSFVTFTPDGSLVFPAPPRRTVTVWGLATKRPERRLFQPKHLASLALSPDGRLLACGEFKNMGLWDFETGNQLLALERHAGFVHAVSFSSDGRLLASASEDHMAKVWQLRTGQPAVALSAAVGVWSIAFSTDGKLVACGGLKNTVRLCDPTSGAVVRSISEGGGVSSGLQYPLSMAFAGDGSFLAGLGNGTVKRWGRETGSEARTIRTTGGAVAPRRGKSILPAPAFSPDGKLVACRVGSDGICILDVATGARVSSLRGTTTSVSHIAFSRDSRLLAAVLPDRTIKLWSVKSGALSRVIRTAAFIERPAFSPDGRLIACGTFDKSVRVVSVETGENKLTLTGHMGYVGSLAFVPGGRLLASSGFGGEVKLWDTATGRDLLTLWVPCRDDPRIVVSPDGKRLATSNVDGPAMVWDIDPAHNPELRLGEERNEQ
ncbi:TIR domain-containing protein [Planctomycetota bacterium]